MELKKIAVRYGKDKYPFCPCCNSEEYMYSDGENENNFCGNCGTPLDWNIMFNINKQKYIDMRTGKIVEHYEDENKKEHFLEPKQIIVVNKELDMPYGKFGAQCAHMSEAFLSHSFYIGEKKFKKLENDNYLMEIEVDIAAKEWLSNSFVKIILAAKNQKDLEKLERKAIQLGFQEGKDFYKIIDEGRTIFDGVPTLTGIGFRPMFPKEIDPLTKRYQLYK